MIHSRKKTEIHLGGRYHNLSCTFAHSNGDVLFCLPSSWKTSCQIWVQASFGLFFLFFVSFAANECISRCGEKKSLKTSCVFRITFGQKMEFHIYACLLMTRSGGALTDDPNPATILHKKAAGLDFVTTIWEFPKHLHKMVV